MPDATGFDALALPPALLQSVRELGFTQPTPIQAQSIPVLRAGRDLVGQSRTGSGKTAAFALPLLEKLRLAERRVQALVLCPTRELSTQVAREVRTLGRRAPGLQVLLLAGGQPLAPQARALEQGVHVVVGTPGRTLDHLRRGTLALEATSFVVLDEADRMLDMGFEEDMTELLGALPAARQTVFFSATFPQSIAQLSRTWQREPVQVTVAEEAGLPPSVHQLVVEAGAQQEDKLPALQWVLGEHRPQSAIVFCNQKATAHALTQELSRAGWSVAALHGDLEQHERDGVMARFRNQSVRVLVATDVAARGLDIAGLDLVCNFDLPSQPEVYVHRIGRTGRAGEKGLAVSLALAHEQRKLEAIEAFTGVKPERQVAGTPERASAGGMGSEMATLMIGAGRKDKLRPGDILGALTGEAAALSAAHVGKIEIQDHVSYVAVSRSVARVALERLRSGRIKGRRFRIDPVR